MPDTQYMTTTQRLNNLNAEQLASAARLSALRIERLAHGSVRAYNDEVTYLLAIERKQAQAA